MDSKTAGEWVQAVDVLEMGQDFGKNIICCCATCPLFSFSVPWIYSIKYILMEYKTDSVKVSVSPCFVSASASKWPKSMMIMMHWVKADKKCFCLNENKI